MKNVQYTKLKQPIYIYALNGASSLNKETVTLTEFQAEPSREVTAQLAQG